MIFLLIAAGVLVGAPLVAAVLVSVASIYEDAAKSLAGRPPGVLAAAARRLLQARVGGAGPLQRSSRLAKPAAGARQHRQPKRATQTRPIQAPRRVADDERVARFYASLAAPRS